MAAGAEWVWVAEISIRSTGTPVACEALVLASSRILRGTMQLSTTQSTRVVRPSAKARARAVRGSTTESAVRSVNMPFTRTGNDDGARSTTAAPAWNGRGFAASGWAMTRPAASSRRGSAAERRRRRGFIGFRFVEVAGGTRHAVGSGRKQGSPAAVQARISRMTWPCTSVRRRSTPAVRTVRRSWSMPMRCSRVACRS